MAETVVLNREGDIVQLLLNRPEAFNAFNPECITGLARHLTACATDASVRGVVIGGMGKAFCAGGDLKEILHCAEGASSGFYRMARTFHEAVIEIRRMPKPVIAAVNGIAAGGGFSLALACDFRVMARSSVLRQAYTSAGLCLDGGGTFLLPRVVGLARALEIAAFDRPISAEQALQWGLATQVVDDGQALEEAMAMARGLSERSMHSYGWVKRLLTDACETPLEVQLERERLGIAACGAHADGLEGMMAFATKRKPVFKRDS